MFKGDDEESDRQCTAQDAAGGGIAVRPRSKTRARCTLISYKEALLHQPAGEPVGAENTLSGRVAAYMPATGKFAQLRKTLTGQAGRAAAGAGAHICRRRSAR